MNTSPFLSILATNGFREGASGRFFDPDAMRYDSGTAVEVDEKGATVFSGKFKATFPPTEVGVREFRSVIAG